MKNFKILISLCILVLVGVSIHLPAQATASEAGGSILNYLPLIKNIPPPVWIGPSGGSVISVAVNPLTPETVYAGTWGAGVYKSTDAGATWSAMNNGLGNQYIYSLAVNPLQPDTLYAGTHRGQLYKSVDGGRSWFWASSGIQSEAIVYTIAIDPVSPNTVYIGTRGASNNGQEPWNGIIYKSENGGANWYAVLTNAPEAWIQDWAYSIAVHPTSPNIVFAAMHQNGVYRSLDYGNTWVRSNKGLEDYTGRSIAIDASKYPFYVYLGCWDTYSVFKSTDGGISWSARATGIINARVWWVTLDPFQPDNVYLGTQNLGIVKSIDGGNHWNIVGLPFHQVWGLAINPQDSQVVYSGSEWDGLTKTVDAGKNWFPSYKGIDNTSASGLATFSGDPKTYYAATKSLGVFYTHDAGENWTQYVTNLLDWSIQTLVQNPSNRNILYALTTVSGLYYTDASQPNGWIESNTGLPYAQKPLPAFAENHPLNRPSVIEEEGDELTQPPGVQQPSTTYHALYSMVFAPTDLNVAYIGTQMTGVYKSIDQGLTWTPTGLNDRSVWSLAVHPSDANLVYAATDVPGSIKVTHNGGLNW
jgi:photosystem II stability/assembly factor-like uncharacterized protein